MAKQAIPANDRRELAVKARDEADRPLIRASLWFKVVTAPA
jgi:hypothetical protein